VDQRVKVAGHGICSATYVAVKLGLILVPAVEFRFIMGWQLWLISRRGV
jgi:hypothetical protein